MLGKMFVLLGLAAAAGCGRVAGSARDPSSPTPVAGPPPTTSPTPRTPAGRARAGGQPAANSSVPLRPAEAPLATVREALEADSLLGRRIRVAGRCTGVGTGRSAGSWTLEDDDQEIEVRGLIPRPCREAGPLTIFAQVEYRTPHGPDRLLLRLPD